jgi:peptidoglycan/LPS O-acetylase OafA/YrhL
MVALFAASQAPLVYKNDRLTNLDGMRGLAAIAVATMHGCVAFNLNWGPKHAYLAVDFFFLLSGYVIARAFDRRLQQGWVIGFLQARMIRLYPIIVVGSLMGFLVLIGRNVSTHSVTIAQALLDTVCSLLVIPTPPLLSQEWRIYPADPPLWSLFYELAANVLYAVTAPLLRHMHLWLIVCLSAFGLACAAVLLNGDGFGLVHFELGSLRVVFSFFLGVAFYRALGPNPQRYRLPIVATPLIFAILATVLFAPGPLGWAYDLVAVFVLFPAILILALMSNPGRNWLQAAFVNLGLASYPLYVVHVPFFWLVSKVLFHNSGPSLRVFGMASSLAVVLALSWLLAKFYDQPVRGWLTARLTPRSTRNPVATG